MWRQRLRSLRSQESRKSESEIAISGASHLVWGLLKWWCRRGVTCEERVNTKYVHVTAPIVVRDRGFTK